MFNNITSNKAFIAVYDINTYTVKWINWDGSIIRTDIVEWGKSATPPQDPTKPGFMFKGWDADYSSVKSNLTITAQFEDASAGMELLCFYSNVVINTNKIENGTYARSDEIELILHQKGTGSVDLVREISMYLVVDDKAINQVGFVDKVAGTPVEVTYTIEDTSIVGASKYTSSYSEYAIFYGKNVGETNITVTYKGVSKKFKVKVKAPEMHVENFSPVDISKWNGAPLSGVPCAHAKTEIIAHNKGESASLIDNLIEVLPNGMTVSRITSDLTVLSGNTELADVTYQSGGYIEMTTKRPGTVQLTITSELTTPVTQTVDIVLIGNAYEVVWVGKDGAELKREWVREGKNANPPTAPVIDGFEFTGWDKPYSGIMADTTITALYKEKVPKPYFEVYGYESNSAPITKKMTMTPYYRDDNNDKVYIPTADVTLTPHTASELASMRGRLQRPPTDTGDFYYVPYSRNGTIEYAEWKGESLQAYPTTDSQKARPLTNYIQVKVGEKKILKFEAECMYDGTVQFKTAEPITSIVNESDGTQTAYVNLPNPGVSSPKAISSIIIENPFTYNYFSDTNVARIEQSGSSLYVVGDNVGSVEIMAQVNTNRGTIYNKCILIVEVVL